MPLTIMKEGPSPTDPACATQRERETQKTMLKTRAVMFLKPDSNPARRQTPTQISCENGPLSDEVDQREVECSGEQATTPKERRRSASDDVIGCLGYTRHKTFAISRRALEDHADAFFLFFFPRPTIYEAAWLGLPSSIKCGPLAIPFSHIAHQLRPTTSKQQRGHVHKRQISIRQCAAHPTHASSFRLLTPTPNETPPPTGQHAIWHVVGFPSNP